MYVCMYVVCMHACMCVCIYLCTYVCMYLAVCMYMYVCMCIPHVCVCVCVCVCGFIYRETHSWDIPANSPTRKACARRSTREYHDGSDVTDGSAREYEEQLQGVSKGNTLINGGVRDKRSAREYEEQLQGVSFAVRRGGMCMYVHII